ncbi:MAG TPA: IS21 family transposase [Candidatus Binatia bacterium]|jgi:transposase
MANRLKMARVQSILLLHSQGWSRRRIARELSIDRETVSRYVQLDQQLAAKCEVEPNGVSKPANAPISAPGSPAFSKPANAPIPGPGSSALANLSPVPIEPASVGRRSDCEPWREMIVAKRDQGLSARRIYQDLAREHAAQVSYDSVRRFMRRLGWARPLPFRRIECAPGQEAQVDFGTGAPVIGADGKRRRTHVFRIVLSHSRKAYSEATYRQTTEDFLGALENAFLHFGGVPQTLIIDNLKAAVKNPDWFDPELVPKVAAFCRHYGTVILPTRPYMPRHKGKVERGVDYVQENGLKGRVFKSLEEQNHHLLNWEKSVADTRIHGTTRKHVGRVFREVEQPVLAPLPAERFPSFQEAQRSVNRDGHVEVAKAYYSAPPEYLGRRVWVRWDTRTVRIFNHRFEQVALHVRHEPGRFSTLGDHLAPEKISGIERGAEWLLTKVRGIGPHASEWAAAMLRARGIAGVRVLQGLLALDKRYATDDIERACETALSYGAFHLRPVRQLIRRQAPKQQSLLEEHPIIRPLAEYGEWLAAALAGPWGKNQRPQFLPPDPHLLPSSLFPINPVHKEPSHERHA